MSDLEQDLRQAFASVVEPNLNVPTGLASQLRQRHTRRRRVAMACVSGAAVTVVAIVGLGAHVGTSSDQVDRLTPAAGLAAPSPAPAASKPAVFRAGQQQLRSVALPSWWSTNDPTKRVGRPGYYEAVEPPRAYSLDGGPPFVTLTYRQGTETRVEVSYYRPADLALGEGVTGSEGVQSGGWPLKGSPAELLAVWPTVNQSMWVWTHLPAGAASIRYNYPGSPVRTAAVLGDVGAITVPRLPLRGQPGTLTLLAADGTPLLTRPAPGIQ